jgi:hypothetical protein
VNQHELVLETAKTDAGRTGLILDLHVGPPRAIEYRMPQLIGAVAEMNEMQTTLIRRERRRAATFLVLYPNVC